MCKSKYDFLNKDEDLMNYLAEMIVSLNYGTIRFLAALVRARSKSDRFRHNDKLSEELSKLIEKDLC